MIDFGQHYKCPFFFKMNNYYFQIVIFLTIIFFFHFLSFPLPLRDEALLLLLAVAADEERPHGQGRR